MKKIFFTLLVCILSFITIAQSPFDTKVTVDKNTGDYTIIYNPMHWIFKGSIGKPLETLLNKAGIDSGGTYNEVIFKWKDSIAYKASIKWYTNTVLLFSIELPQGSAIVPPVFPSFTLFPANMYPFSFYDDNFAPPQFKLNETATPWLFFNDNLDAYILSPASDFIVSKMIGDGKTIIGSGLNPELKNLPNQFTHRTLLAIGKGIQNTWNEWGSALRKLYNRKIPENDADIPLKYFGYWTDNGADYYYNYDSTKGYTATLLALRKKYKEEGIPLGYMQLDSWWYDKSIYDVDGKPLADHKNKKLPYGKWNRYGGLMSYTADSFLFPKGLSSFYKELGLPMVTHNRWVDPMSPYHNNYKFSGFAAIDFNYWNHIIQNIHKNGVVTYEQDWLNYIYSKSPEMATDLNIGNAFTDNMSKACSNNKLTMQYCMAMPRHFLQGVKYDNLTTIRTSEDRFNPENWKPFIYVSQLGYEIGAWPWCDVFKSDEMGNMILAVLSAGPVGTGDAIGKENKENILKTCRNDGVLVKPDAPILPLDETYLNEAQGKDLPMLAATFTKHNTILTNYVFAFTTSKTADRNIVFNASTLGQKAKVVIFNPLSKKLTVQNATADYKDELPEDLYAYYIIAPITTSGIAFLGDAKKIAATGKKRIAAIKDERGKLQVSVLFAKGEPFVTLQGYSEKAVIVDKGIINYDTNTHLFTLIVSSNNTEQLVISLHQ